ncbi:MAG: ABC transporter ATP-binding protein [Clostridia bacterium]|nr:ABC transporter ATP-binding protein [Clostridia bacterium]
MKHIFRYMRPYAGRMSFGLVIKIVGTLMDLALPWMLATMLDEVVPTGDKVAIVALGIAMLIAALIGFFGNVIANRIAAAVARDTTRGIRRDLFRKSMYLSCSQVEQVSVASLETRLTSDTYNIHQMVGMMQRMGVRAPILLVGGIACAFIMEARLALVMLGVLPFISVAVYFIGKRGRRLYHQVQSATDRLVRKVRQISKGIRVIKAFSTQKTENEGFEKLNVGLSNAEKRAGMTMGASNPIMTILLNLGLTCVILVGAFLVHDGVTGAGKIVAFMNYFTIIANAMLVVTRIFMMYSKSAASAQRISSIMDMQTDQPVLDDATVYDSHAVCFNDVCFSYNQKDKDCLSNISFTLDKGRTLGIVGATGSGKSTVLRLLLRLYDATQGKITVFGKDVRSYEPEQLHQSFAAVMQNDFVFSGSVYQNVAFGRDISPEQAERALRMAKADYVFDDPDRLEKHITTKGTNISGGQRQRLLIARAIACNPQILILDDSSSALDYKTDAAIRKDLAELDITKMIIAQRISSVMSADKILVMDKGRIVASGTHDELLKECELYKEISLSQIGGAMLE